MSKQSTPRHELARALREIDKELTGLIARRAVLLTEIKPVNPTQAMRRQWQELERELWQLWEQEAQACRSDVRGWRKLFSQAQELTAAADPEEASRAYTLSPRQEPSRIDMRGAGCTLCARLWACLAAQVKTPFTVPRIVRNDLLVEFVKALNQAGASLFWDASGLHSRGQSLASFGEGVVFAGEDRFNLLLLIASCLGRAGAARFTGGAGLKLEDFSGLRSFLPQLGARMAFMHPGSSSVPFRLECSGVLPEEVRLPHDMEPDFAALFALALCVCAHSYGSRFTLKWDAPLEAHVSPLVATGVHILESCGIRATLQEGACTVFGGELALPEQPLLPLDPFVSMAFLAVPYFIGGIAVLHGVWPRELPQWRGVASFLEAAGLRFEVEGGEVRCSARQTEGFHELPLEEGGHALPLALVVCACQAQRSGREVRLRLPGVSERELEPSNELMGLLGIDAVWDEGGYVLRRGAMATTGAEAFVAPDARWCVAASLASFCKPGLQLANPGQVAELLPHFWQLFNALPDPGPDAATLRRSPVKEETNGKKRRRLIVRS